MSNNARGLRRNINLLSEETRQSVLPADVDLLIQRGALQREGNWYRVNDVRILGNELHGLIKRLFVSRSETLVQLHV